MNNFKVSIKNYQIIKNMNLEFIPGLNVIVGPSNNGKTSILKAIKALLYTVPGSTPIRVGQSSYIVGIEYNRTYSNTPKRFKRIGLFSRWRKIY